MTPDQINGAIAEECGWKFDLISGYKCWRLPIGEATNADPPSYHSDLNACAEMEATLTKHERYLYIKFIADTKYKLDDAWDYVHATSPQRCEAFLRVKGKWSA